MDAGGDASAALAQPPGEGPARPRRGGRQVDRLQGRPGSRRGGGRRSAGAECPPRPAGGLTGKADPPVGHSGLSGLPRPRTMPAADGTTGRPALRGSKLHPGGAQQGIPWVPGDARERPALRPGDQRPLFQQVGCRPREPHATASTTPVDPLARVARPPAGGWRAWRRAARSHGWRHRAIHPRAPRRRRGARDPQGMPAKDSA